MLLLLATVWPLGAQNYPFQDTSLTVEERVADLLGRLTLDEKLSLMEHQNPAIERLGIAPYSWWNEALHGVARNGKATVYPMPIALAATFDPEQIEDVFGAIADEAVRKHRQSQASGQYGDNTGITFFTPNINIFRDPRWGRGMETFGEDPYLTARMGLAAVQGLQGSAPYRTMRYNEKVRRVRLADGTLPMDNSDIRHDDFLLTAACLKHLAVHSGPEGLRHEFNSQVSDRDLWTTYLPAFEYIIKHSDVQQVMCGYNRLNGDPCCTNEHLLVDILRNKWHYDNILVTDCWALNDCWEPDTVIPRHRTHATAAQAAAAAFGSEVDLECGSGLAALRTAVDSGYISVEQIDKHVARLLRTRFRIRPEAFDTLQRSWRENPKEVAASSLVLLKNDDVLPIDEFSMKQIAVVGPNFADSAMALGNYNGNPPYVKTVYQAFRERAILHFLSQQETPGGENFRDMLKIYGDTACHLAGDNCRLPKHFWKQLKKSDVIVFVGGLSPALEGEELQVNLPGFYRGDRTAIELPEVQRRMIKDIRRRTGKPIVLVLCTGSAIGLEEVIDDVDAVVVAWYGGQDMGTAVCDALTGVSNSWGRLPVTFYRSTAQLPPFENYDMQGRTYRYMTEEPLFPFGYGLSYSHFSYDSLAFDRQTLTLTGRLSLDSIDNGCLLSSGKEVIQVYLQTPSNVQGPKEQLIALERHWLDTYNRSVSHFSITLDPDWLRSYNPATGEMELPKPGTPLRLRIAGGGTVDFVW